jgi:uncharacterized protein YfbU (UPF0304 family)
MWSFIESSYKKLSANDRQRLKDEAAPFGEDPKFSGFDGNNESEYYSAARFLIDDMRRFGSFADRDIDSHSASVERNARMLDVFLPIRDELGERPRLDLTVDDLIAILGARVHPRI